MYHFRVKVIGRSSGRSAAGAVAYRAGGRAPAASVAYRMGETLRDELTGQRFDYRAKGRVDADGHGVLHTEILAPPGAPAWVLDLQRLVSTAEAAETRKDAQYFRELEISLPRELSLEDQRTLIRAFVEKHCVKRGMVAMIAIHNERAADGGDNPHAHVILSMRTLEANGFGKKERAWNSREIVQTWRKAWAALANDMLEARGFDARLDHRSFRDRDIDLEPDVYVGPKQAIGRDGVIACARSRQRDEVKAINRKRALADPDWFLAQITRMQSTFTLSDLGVLIRRYTGLEHGDPDARALADGVLKARDLLPISTDKGAQIYSSRTLVECEMRMVKSAARLAQRARPAPTIADQAGLSPAQRRAAQHVLDGPDLVAIEGVAGAGKTFLLDRVRASFENDGRRVRGIALSAIVARNLGRDAGIESMTIRSFLKDQTRAQPFDALRRGDVLVLDEAGLVGTRDFEAILGHVERAGAKLVMVGDTRQLQAIEAGAAFRSLVQTHGAARLSEVRRQKAEPDRAATSDFARGQTQKALIAYQARGALRAADTRASAMRALIFDWMQSRRLAPSQLILAHRRADAAELNRLARLALKSEGLLGKEVSIPVTVLEEIAGAASERQERRCFAVGDDILFTRNDHTLGVQNGALGRLSAIKPGGEFIVTFPDGRVTALNPKYYSYLENGYAMTVHKAQGATVDRAYVFASATFDAHLTYVAMTRHRDQVGLYYASEEFEGADLIATLSRDRPKDMALDYLNPALTRDLGAAPPERGRGLERD
jgi:Ti-type conjugative transfer relaxase TraA